MVDRKIFFVANSEYIHTSKWVDYFVDRGYDVYLATFALVNNTKCKNIFYLSSNGVSKRGGNYYYLLKIFELSKIFREIKPNIINAHYSYSLGFIALLALKLSKIETIYSVVCHGSDILDVPFGFFEKINKFVLKNSDKVFAVSNQIKDKLEELNIEMNKIFVGQYGLDNTLKENSYLIKDIDILSNRAYNSNSNIELLLESLAIKKDIEKLKVVFVLPTIRENNLQKLKEKYPYIEFYSDIEYSKMMNFIMRSKVYISATKSDGTALSLLEAMLYGAVPLISNIISNRSWILDGVNGYLFNGKKDFLTKLNLILILDRKRIEEIQYINKRLIIHKAIYRNQMKKIEEFIQ